MKKFWTGLLLSVTASFAFPGQANACVGCSRLEALESSMTLVLGGSATGYIQNRSTLQSGATFYTSSGTVMELRADNFQRSGAINIATNPVDWSQLKNVPAGFSDGSDDAGGAAAGVPKLYEVVVGTPGMPNVDYNVAKSSDLWPALARLSANGLTTSATGQGTILFIGGPFDIYGATNPAGVTMMMIKGSSSTWMPTESTGTIIMNYGTLKDLSIDGSSIPAYSGYKIMAMSGSRIDGLKMRYFKPFRVTGRAVGLGVVNQSTVILKGVDLDYVWMRSETAVFGDNAPVTITHSSNVIITEWRTGTNFTQYQANNPVIGLVQTGHTIIEKGIADNTPLDSTCHMIGVEGGNLHWAIRDNIFYARGGYGTRGYINIGSNSYGAGTPVSSGTISGNRFHHMPGAANTHFIGLNNLASGVQGVLIAGNEAINLSGGTPNFCLTGGAPVFGTVLINNMIRGMTFISDSGTQTKYAGNDNFIENVEQ